MFQALTSSEIIDWWVNPDVFDTREWSGDVRAGGRWHSSGDSRRGPYSLEGEYLVVDPPHKLMHTWRLQGVPGTSSTVTYLLDRTAGGTRLTLRHAGAASADTTLANCMGWERSFESLRERLAA